MSGEREKCVPLEGIRGLAISGVLETEDSPAARLDSAAARR